MVLAGLVGTPQSEALADMFAGVVLVCPIAYMNNITSTFDRAAAELYLDKVLVYVLASDQCFSEFVIAGEVCF